MIPRPIRAIGKAVMPRRLWNQLRAVQSNHNIRRVEAVCLREMVGASATLVAAPTAPSLPAGTPLRKILLIADVMWEANELVPELEKICAVEMWDLRPALKNCALEDSPGRVTRRIEEFLQQSAGREPDLVLMYLRGNLLSEELFGLIRKHLHAPLLGLNLDDRVSFWDYGSAGGGDHYQKWARFFDLNLTNSKIASTWYHQAGAACIYSPPGFHLPKGLSEPDRATYRQTLSFVGSPKLDRKEVVDRLQMAGLPVTVFGKGWPQANWVDNPTTVYRESQINLGLGMASPHCVTMKNRDFECPGVGAFYLTTYNWELTEWWDIGREILCYRNTEELIEIVAWYRNRPADCLKIARAAWRRAIAEHTWEQRFRKIFKALGFSV